MKHITKGIIAIILLASIAIGSYYLIQVYLPYRAEQQRILEQENLSGYFLSQQIIGTGNSVSLQRRRDCRFVEKRTVTLSEKYCHHTNQ